MCHVATGSDIGYMSHGRKQFNEMMQAAETYVDAKIGEFLSEPLKCTGLPLHYYATEDRSTVHRTTIREYYYAHLLKVRERLLS